MFFFFFFLCLFLIKIRIFPKRVKVIVSCENSSSSFQYFQKLNCKILNVNVDPQVGENMIERHKNRELYLVITN